MVAKPRGAQFALKLCGNGGDLLVRIGTQLNGKDGARISLDKEAVLTLLKIRLRTLENIIVHQLARARSVTQSDQIGPEGFVNTGPIPAPQPGLTPWHR